MAGHAEIAVIGAGPAGSFAAEELARAGRSVVFFDPRGPWEKPCGGGVTARGLKRYRFLLDDPTWPKQMIDRVTIVGPSRRRLSLEFDEPFAVYSRERLNALMLERARAAGAEFVGRGVSRFAREGDGWRITTREGEEWTAHLLVGADGAAGVTRTRLVGHFGAPDFAATLGYNGPGGGSTEVLIDFPPGWAGYIWAFPRTDHVNFGIACRMGERTGRDLKEAIRGFVDEYYGGEAPREALEQYGAKLPMLAHGSWDDLRATGPGWALVGDAAGFVDPITGEGIYFAIRSAELLAEALASGAGLAGYERAWREDFGEDLAHASKHFERFYKGTFMGRPVVDRALQFAAHHKGVRRVMLRALAAEQSYETLKRDLILSAPRIF